MRCWRVVTQHSTLDSSDRQEFVDCRSTRPRRGPMRECPPCPRPSVVLPPPRDRLRQRPVAAADRPRRVRAPPPRARSGRPPCSRPWARSGSRRSPPARRCPARRPRTCSSPRRHGRRVLWELTDDGRRLLEEGTRADLRVHARAAPWDGRWLVLCVPIPETQRQLRHRLRTRLTWLGLGSPTSGLWVTPDATKAGRRAPGGARARPRRAGVRLGRAGQRHR